MKALEDAGVTLDDIDAIGVTYTLTPGALLVGARRPRLAFAKNKPLVGVHHIGIVSISANHVEIKNSNLLLLRLLFREDIHTLLRSTTMASMK